MLKINCRLIMAAAFVIIAGTAALAENDQIPVQLTVNDAVCLALKNSSLIRQATDAIAAQENSEKIARADLLPSVSASYRYTRLKDAPFVLFNNQPFDMNGVNQVHWDVSLRQPLFTGFALVSRRELESLGIDVKIEEKRQAMLLIIQKVKTAYFNVLLAKQFKKAADEAVDQLSVHLDDARRFYDQGLIAYNDVLKSQVALADARQNATKAGSRVAMAVSAFNVLVGLPFEQETDVMAVTELPPMPASIAPLISEAIDKRPLIRGLRLKARQADLAVTMAESAYYPNIYLEGRYEQNGQNFDASSNDYANWHNAGISVAVQWDLLDWGKRHADVRRRMNEKDIVEAKINAIEDDIRLEVKQSYLDLSVAAENIRTAEESLELARENYRITNVQYQENMVTSTDVVDARTDLTRAESNHYSAFYGYQIAAAALDRAIGRMPSPGELDPGGHDIEGKPPLSTIQPVQ